MTDPTTTARLDVLAAIRATLNRDADGCAAILESTDDQLELAGAAVGIAAAVLAQQVPDVQTRGELLDGWVEAAHREDS